MKKVLITGIFGQDGQILSKLLSDKKYKIFGLFNKNKKKTYKNIKYKKINLLKYDHVENYLKFFKPNCIIHLASFNNSNSYQSNQVKKIDYGYNFKMTKNLIDAALTIKKKPIFILAGSSQMYGNKKKIVKENSVFKPNNYYAKYKVDSHNYLMKVKKKNFLKATTAILFNHDSIFRNKKFLLPRIIKYLKSNDVKAIEKIRNLNIGGDFSHAESICRGIVKIIVNNSNPDKIILSSNKYTKINDVIDYLIKKKRLNIILKLKSKIKNKKTLGNNNLAKKIINWKPNKDYYKAALEIYNFS